MGNYDQLIDELGAYSRRSKPKSFRADRLADHQRELGKAIGQMRRIADARMAAEPAEPAAPAPAETMAKAHEMFRAGRITGEQLRSLEARQHHLASAAARSVR